MALSDYQPETRKFDLKGGSFSVRGLALEDVAVLIRTHLPDLEALFDVFENAAKVSDSDFAKVAASVASQAPGFAANAIALAADEPESAPNAARLPFPVQVEALVAIGDLTFTEVGGVKKALETVAGLLARMNLTKEEAVQKVRTIKKRVR